MKINKSREAIEDIFSAMELANLRCQLHMLGQIRPGVIYTSVLTPFWNIVLKRDKDGSVQLIQGCMEILRYCPFSGIITLDYSALMNSVPKSMRKSNAHPVAMFLLYLLNWTISELNGGNEFVHDTMLRSNLRKKVRDLHGLLERVVELRYGPLYDTGLNFIQEVGGGIGVYSSEGMLQYYSDGNTASVLTVSNQETIAKHFAEAINQVRATAICIRTNNNKLHCELGEKLIKAHTQRIRQNQLAKQELVDAGKQDQPLVLEYKAVLPDGSSVEFLNDRITYIHQRGSSLIGTMSWYVGSENANVSRDFIKWLETTDSIGFNITNALENALNQYKAFLLSQLSKVNLGVVSGFPITDKNLAEKYVVYMTLRETGYRGTFEDYNKLTQGK